jgi:hypothetical protein
MHSGNKIAIPFKTILVLVGGGFEAIRGWTDLATASSVFEHPLGVMFAIFTACLMFGGWLLHSGRRTYAKANRDRGFDKVVQYTFTACMATAGVCVLALLGMGIYDVVTHGAMQGSPLPQSQDEAQSRLAPGKWCGSPQRGENNSSVYHLCDQPCQLSGTIAWGAQAKNAPMLAVSAPRPA